MSYQDDKRELLKLKQGLIEESETIKEEKAEKTKLSPMKKIENFFYHYKLCLIAGVFIALVVGFLAYDLLSRENADVRILYMSSDWELSQQLSAKQKKVELALEQYCPDYDNDGNVHCEIFYIDRSGNADAQYEMAFQAKLYGEYSSGVANMYITDKATIEEICGEEDVYSMFTDLSALYPLEENIDGIYYKLKDTDFARLCGWDMSCPDDLYIVVRTVNGGMTSNAEEKKINNAHALTLLDNIISGTLQGAVDTMPFLS